MTDVNDALIKFRLNCDSTGHNYQVIGKIRDANLRVRFKAPASTDLRLSVAGTALPWSNPKQAFEGSNNSGMAALSPHGDFKFTVVRPNAYYVQKEQGLGGSYWEYMAATGMTLVPPHLEVELLGPSGHLVKRYSINLSDGYPLRSLIHLPGKPSRAPRKPSKVY